MLIIAAAFCPPSFAQTPLTYDWQGTNGFTGSFTFDSSALFSTGSSAFPLAINESSLTAFSFSGGGVTFGLADIVGGSAIFFDNSNPPLYLDGGGTAAINAGNELIFFSGQVAILGGGSSIGTFAPVAQTPEPTTIILYGTGLLGIRGVAFHRKRLGSPSLAIANNA